MNRVRLILVMCAVLALPVAAVAHNPIPKQTSESTTHNQNGQNKQPQPTQVHPVLSPSEVTAQKQQSPPAEERNETIYGDSAKPDWWARIIELIAAIATVALAVIGYVAAKAALGTLRVIQEQTGHLRTAAKSAADSAQAASNNTKVLIDIERAWLIPDGPVIPKSLPAYRLAPVQTETLTVKIRNFGRTPAWITDLSLDFEVLDNTNIEEFTDAQIPEPDHPSARPVPSGKKEELSKEWNIRSSSILDDIQAGRKHLYVFGYVQYRTAMSKELSCSHFCFHYFRYRRADGNFEEGWMLEPPTANHYT